MSEDFPPKRILILASKLGYQTRAFADAAKRLGVEVSLGTDRCHKLDDPWGDGARALHFENPEESASEIVRETMGDVPDAIVALGDRATATAARAACALGLISNSPEAVEICRNKLRQRETLKLAGLLVPDFFAFALDEDITSVLTRVSFPCVVKPLIQIARDGTLDRVLVERYIPGREVAVEGLITEGRLRVLAIFDKPDPLEGPYFEETIYVTPSRLPQRIQNAIADCAAKCVAALGLVTGPVHAEFRINESGVWVIEVAPRPIGGLCSRALRFGAEGISLEELILRHALGLGGGDCVREGCAAGVMMIPVPRSGIFEGVEGIEAARRVRGVEDVLITARLHDNVAAWPEGASYLGFIFSRGESAEEAEAALRVAHSKLNFVIGARLPVEHPVTGRILA